jgi:hypothetical protein
MPRTGIKIRGGALGRGDTKFWDVTMCFYDTVGKVDFFLWMR